MAPFRSRVPGVIAAAIVALSVTVFPQNSGLGTRGSEPAASDGEATLRIIVLETEDEARRAREEARRARLCGAGPVTCLASPLESRGDHAPELVHVERLLHRLDGDRVEELARPLRERAARHEDDAVHELGRGSL